jgi:sulfate transport system ATP-binding protein
LSIRLENISKRYGQLVVVNNLSLEIHDGEFFVLLGSSGSGKTTVLNIIAGLTDPDQGQVFLHDRNVTRLPTQARQIGFVFQNYALFQYMTVAENIEFGLQVRKTPRAQRRRKRDELLELVGLVGLGERMPSQLSGGQQQRVALARALALDPDVLLLDEPLGALDAKIRVELRRSLKNIQRQLGVAAILVTHDQDEAFDLGDRIGVMNFGRLIEVGTPHELYQRPQTEFVASFLGTANLLLGQAQGSEVRIGKHAFPLPTEAASLSSDGRAQILFRPEDVALASSAEELGCLPLGEGTVVETGFNGPTERLRLELPSIAGVRPIVPTVHYGHPGIFLEASRSPDQSAHLPIKTGKKVWVGIRRLHALSHPGLHFLLVTDASLRSQSALSLGGYLARMAHARVTLLGLGKDEGRLKDHLQEARKQIGSGMAALQTRSSSAPFSQAIHTAAEEQPLDLVVLGWRPTAGLDQPEQVLQAGDHHLLLATQPEARLSRALICVASGEPGKDDVLFAGRLLRHVGAEATLMTVQQGPSENGDLHTRVERFIAGGLHSLARFGIEARSLIKNGDPLSVVLDELRDGDYDLVVLGAPFPDRQGHLSLGGVVGAILRSGENQSFLIVRSHQYKPL